MENTLETDNQRKEEFEKIETEEKSMGEIETVDQQSADKSSSQDYYQVLGVPRDATEKQINAAYKKLALQYHPDRNTDKDAAEVKFRELNDAYHVLIDPNKRRQYDLRGDKTTNEFESVDVSTLGGIGRVFGAMISRLGIPIPTQISQDILTTAQTICRNGSIEGGGPPLDSRVSDLTWGWGAEGKVDRQAGVFYRLTVDAQHSDGGFLVNCRSNNRGKFKLILFDKEGSVLFQEESTKDREKSFTQATLFFTNFDTYRLGETYTPPEKASSSSSSSQGTVLPSVFHRLENFYLSKHKLSSGQYLLCVYGDNFIGKTNFNIIAVPAKNDSSEVHALEEMDEKLLETKSLLNSIKTEYVQAKAAYEAVINKIKTEEEKLEKALQEREQLYNTYVDNSITVFAPAESVKQHNAESGVDTTASTADTAELHANNSDEASMSIASTDGSTNSNTSRFAFLSANTLAAATSISSTAALNAAHNVRDAGGWLARRLSFGIQSIVKGSSVKSEDGISEEAPSNLADAGDGSVVSDNEPQPTTAPDETTSNVSNALSIDSATSGVAESLSSI